MINIHAICRIPPVSREHPFRYRGYSIRPGGFDAFEFAHDDFDEDPSSGDVRCGNGTTIEHCRTEIDEIEGMLENANPR